MSELLSEKIEKLPLWARTHINDLTRERDKACRTLREFLDSQTVTSLYTQVDVSGLSCGSVFAQHYISNSAVTFVLGPEDKHYYNVKVSLRHNHAGVPYLDVNAPGGSLAIRPMSGNAFEIFIPSRV